MKSAEEWLDIWTERIDKAPDGPVVGSDWYMQQEREHLEDIRAEQRHVDANKYARAMELIGVAPEHRVEVSAIYNDIWNAGKAK